MQVELKVNGKSIQIEMTAEQLKELGVIKPKTGYERAEKGSTYFFNDESGDIDSTIDEKDMVDQGYYDIGNYYNDETITKNNARADKLLRRLRQWQAANDRPISMSDWKNDNILKYCVDYDYFNERLFAKYTTRYRCLNNVYFTSEEKAEEAIKKFKDELEWYFTTYVQRLDEV